MRLLLIMIILPLIRWRLIQGALKIKFGFKDQTADFRLSHSVWVVMCQSKVGSLGLWEISLEPAAIWVPVHFLWSPNRMPYYDLWPMTSTRQTPFTGCCFLCLGPSPVNTPEIVFMKIPADLLFGESFPPRLQAADTELWLALSV